MSDFISMADLISGRVRLRVQRPVRVEKKRTPKRLKRWVCRGLAALKGQFVFAHTKSEARSLFKKRLFIDRLPVDVEVAPVARGSY
jgi:hypothetical protein